MTTDQKTEDELHTSSGYVASISAREVSLAMLLPRGVITLEVDPRPLLERAVEVAALLPGGIVQRYADQLSRSRFWNYQ
jgi:hypothetical protein